LVFALWLCLITTGFQSYGQNKAIDSLKRELLKSRTDTNRIKLLTTLAFHYRVFDPAVARKYRAQAWVLSEKLNFNKGKGWYYYLEGVDLTYQNKFSPALNAEAKAIKLGRQSGDHDLIGRAYNAIGVNHLRLEDDTSAMKAFTTALRYINHSTDQTLKPALLLNIGKLYAKLKKHPEALSYFDQARKIYTSLNDAWGLSLTYLEVGNVYQALKQYDKAIGAANLSLQAAREAKYTRTKVNALILLGSLNLTKNNLSKAKINFKAAADSATLTNMHNEKLRIYNGIAAIAEKEGNDKEAFLNKRKATILADSIFNANRSKLILEYQEKFQTEQKETENKLLRDQQKVVQNRFKQRNQILYLTLSVLAGFIVFSLILFWGNKHIKKTNQLLTEQKDQIQQQKENVEQLNQIKDKLFSLIAHDLRSPFASMKSMMDMYDEGTISKDDLDFFFKEIRKDIGFNSLLLDNLLIWAKSQLYGFNIDPKPVSVERLASHVLYHFKKQLESKEISIFKDIPAGSIVHADHEMVNTVFRNLIGNAIKFTPKKGTIKISCYAEDSNLQIAISDSGIGISEENKEKIFQDTFFTTQGLNKEKGTGLGLQICKEFIEKNNGKIWVESELGMGSSFCFTLPKSTMLPVEIFDNIDEGDETEQSLLKEGIKGSISLQIKYDRYELLSKVSLETIWDSDLFSREISWNEALHTNFGYPDERTSIEWWDEKIHPEDFEQVKLSVRTALNEKRDSWESEYRFRCADGIYRYVHDRGLILYDDNKKPFRLMGIMQNVEAQKNAVKEIQRLSLVATSVNNMVVITDAEDKVVWVNDAFVNHTGYSLLEMIGEQPQEFLSGPDTSMHVLKEMKNGLQDKDFSVELINYAKSGEAYWVQIDTTQYRDPITNKKGYVSIQTVITERKEDERIISNQNRTLRQIAYICSHDVQMPLYSILSLIKRLNSNNLSPEDFREAVALLDMSAGKLDSLIYEIHNQISKIERESV
jgi:PAS domain S-box-containing protein